MSFEQEPAWAANTDAVRIAAVSGIKRLMGMFRFIVGFCAGRRVIRTC